MKLSIWVLALALWLGGSGYWPSAHAQVLGSTVPRYDIGEPTLRDVWVDPLKGNDSRTGATRALALRTLDAAWNRIPANNPLTTGYRIQLVRGTYPESNLPNYLENRRGTAQFPIIIQAADGRGSATLQGDLNIFGCSYIYLLDFKIIPVPAGDTLHFEQSNHILMRGLVLNGGTFRPDGAGEIAHDNLKINQCQYVYLEETEVMGAGDNAVDYVAVQYGHAVRNKIHNSNDWGFYTKGGSAYLTIEANEIYDCGTGGYTAGQGTGFQFMTKPWIHYEAYDIKVINNLIHDCQGAGLGINGGYNILMAYNTLVRVGTRDHAVEFVHGLRSCDGVASDDRSACGTNLKAGGWGTLVIDDGTNAARIPNRNIDFYNNIIYNPPGSGAVGQIFQVAGPVTGSSQVGTNIPTPSRADENLRIRGNLIWIQGASLGVDGDSEGCGVRNAACNETQLRRDNTINSLQPQLVDATHNNFRPVVGGNVLRTAVFDIPAFIGQDRPTRPLSPAGNNDNRVSHDMLNVARAQLLSPGAYASNGAATELAGVEFTYPSKDSALTSLSKITGNVRVASGQNVSNVKLYLQRHRDKQYWNGSSWVPTVTPLATALNGVTWARTTQLPTGPTLIDDLYALQATAYSNTGAKSSATISIVIDKTPPQVSFTGFSAGMAITSLGTVRGQTVDVAPLTGSVASGVERVELFLQRRRDGLYWDGNGWATSTPLTTTVAGTHWTSAVEWPTGVALEDGSYYLLARAIDRAGNRGTTLVSITMATRQRI